MPIYEYMCYECSDKFEVLRPMANADEAICCPVCSSADTSRTITVFFAKSGGNIIAGGEANCSACSAHNCSSCGQ